MKRCGLLKPLGLGLGVLLSGFIHSQEIEIWGTAGSGGNGMGTIYKTDGNGDNLEVTHKFGGMPIRSAFLTQLAELEPGVLYGTSMGGGNTTGGSLFKYVIATKEYTELYGFGKSGGGDGLPRNPGGRIVKASNGNLFGTTRRGGTGEFGVLYEYDLTTRTLFRRVEFDTATNGALGIDGLLEANGGLLYGIAGQVGKTEKLFAYDPITHVYHEILQTPDSSYGYSVVGILNKGSNGKLYGLASRGGQHDMGVIFEIDLSDSSWHVKHHFDGTGNTGPRGFLLESSNGRCFGMTPYGGANNEGIFFEYNYLLDSFVVHLNFAKNSNLPRYPLYNNLCLGNNGLVYGISANGGSSNLGVFFSFNPATNVFAYLQQFPHPSIGFSPGGAMMQASNGKLYGVTTLGSDGKDGALFSYNYQTGVLNQEQALDDDSKGSAPIGELLFHSNGKLYGIAGGGKSSSGVLYSIHPVTNEYQLLIDFEDVEGEFPYGSLTEVPGGIIYGVARGQGAKDDGVIFSFNPFDSKYEVVHSFDKNVDGTYPSSGLVRYSNGLYYGLNGNGMTNNAGTIYSFNPADKTVSVHYEFGSSADGMGFALGNLVELHGGLLYGVTVFGGSDDKGVVFSFNPGNQIVQNVVSLGSKGMGSVQAGLSRGPSGLLYGTSSLGGSGDGTLFSLNPVTKELKSCYKFSELAVGRYPSGRLLWASNNKLYGVNGSGGPNSDLAGTIFEYNPVSASGNVKYAFDLNTGKQPSGGLVELYGKHLAITEQAGFSRLNAYPNPTDEYIHIQLEEAFETAQVGVFDMHGKLVLQKDYQTNNCIRLSMKSLPQGLYLLNVNLETTVQTFRVVKE